MFDRHRKIIVCVALALGTLTVYWPVHRYDFVNYDDGDYVAANPHIQGGLNLDSLKWAFTHAYASNWHPLTWLSHMLDVQLFGLNAGPHHVVSVIFHIANTLLLFLVLIRMTRALWRSALVAALFAWHPLHVESVAWIAERKDVLSTFFALLTLCVYAWYVQSSRRRYLFLAFGLFALGLMAKPMLVTLPFVLLLIDFWPLERMQRTQNRLTTFRALVFEKLPFFVLSTISSIVTFAVQNSGGTVDTLQDVPFWYRPPNAVLSYARYLYKAVLPINLAAIYPMVWPLRWWQIASADAVLMAGLIAAVYWANRRPWLLVGWLWFLGTLVPVIGLVQVGKQAMADRYSYLPLIGVFIIFAWALAELTTIYRLDSHVVTAVIGAVLIVQLLMTARQVRVWSSSQALWEHAIATTPNNWIAHDALGRDLLGEGRLDEAQKHFEELLRIFPNLPEAHFNLGLTMARQGKFEEAVAQYQLETKLNASMHYNFGNALMKLNRFDEALAHFSEAARLDPQMAEAQNNWGYALTAQGRFREAAEHYVAALRINPKMVEAQINAGHSYEQLGETSRAAEYYAAALRIDPNLGKANPGQ